MYRKKSPINFPLVSFLGQEYFLKSPRNITSEASNLISNLKYLNFYAKSQHQNLSNTLYFSLKIQI